MPTHGTLIVKCFQLFLITHLTHSTKKINENKYGGAIFCVNIMLNSLVL